MNENLKAAIAALSKLDAVYVSELLWRGKMHAVANVVGDDGTPTNILVLSDQRPVVTDGRLKVKE